MSNSERRLEFRNYFQDNLGKRMVTDKIVKIIVVSCVVIAIIPLGSILADVVRMGIEIISYEFLTALPGAAGSGEGGIANSIQGTFIMIGMTSAIGIPIGVLSGIYVSEYANSRVGKMIRFFNDVMMQFPSIVFGIFAFLFIVLVLGKFNLWAGAVALSLIMFPIIARTTEEALKLIPDTYREAGHALGIPKAVVTVKILLTAAKGGIVTGVMLSVARIAGETAPLIMTILGSKGWFRGTETAMDALPLTIWRLSLLPYDEAVMFGWGAALVLITILLVLNMSVRYLVLYRKGGSGSLGMFMRITGGKK